MKARAQKISRYRIFFYLLALLIVTSAILLAYIDNKVAKRLNGTDEIHLQGILSDSLKLTSNTQITQTVLKDELRRRNYNRVSGKVEKPGQYTVGDGYIEFITKSWRDAFNIKRHSQHIIYDYRKKRIYNLSDPETNVAFLEPEVVASLDESSTEARRFTPLDSIPKYLKDAVVAIEDRRFFSHFGLDALSLLRAIWVNIRAGKVVQGGSTITQQLAKNIFFSPKRTFSRKILEALAALSLEFRSSKEKILEMYLNEVYLGQSGAKEIHGVGEAAKEFFGRNVSEITLGEAALLAGLIKAPSYFSPRKHPNRARKRRDLVLRVMRQQGYINDYELMRALAEGIKVNPISPQTNKAPYFVAALKQEIKKNLRVDALISAGAAIYTGILLPYQICAQKAVKTSLSALKKHPRRINREKELQAALVSIESGTGKIRAYVGGRDYLKNQYDHAFQAKRQIGSAVKPFIYLTAIDWRLNDYKVATPISILPDKPITITLAGHKVWKPQNYARKFYGDVTLRYAFENSLNVPAVYVAQRVGIKAIVNTLRKFRVSRYIPPVPAIALGAIDTSVLELTASYGAFANGGSYVPPRFYISVADGKDIILKNPFYSVEISNEEPVYVMTDLMRGVVERGTGKVIRRLGYKGPAAGKTGTSDKARDAWFVGFTPSLVTGVWVGYDDNSPTGLTGGSAAAPIWARYMKCIEPYVEKEDFIPPQGVVFLDIDYETGAIAAPDCPSKVVAKEVFVKGTEPDLICRRGGNRERSATQYKARDPFKAKKKRKRGLWDVLFGRKNQPR
ncbi:MAG: penicillin-binding protein [Candidatus Dadabacteria bacterium]|nr:MAG: penicillin-binding protein [Candidatus Dadabacteria bacterium]